MDSRDEQDGAVRDPDVRDAARALLDHGETLREVAATNVAFGDWGPVDQWQPLELKTSGWVDRVWEWAHRGRVRRIVFWILAGPPLLLLSLDSIGPSALLDRLLGGRTCEGPRDSTARHMQHALSTFGGRATHLVISDRRLLLARREYSTPRFTAVSSVPHAAIASARRRPRGPFRRRVELQCRDGSRIVLALPLFDAPPPGRIVAALDVAERRDGTEAR